MSLAIVITDSALFTTGTSTTIPFRDVDPRPSAAASSKVCII